MDADFKKRLLETFKIETQEHLAAISAALIDLEKNGINEEGKAALDAISREAHSMKGAARAVNAVGIEQVSHAFEGVFAALKKGTTPPSAALFDLLHRTVDAVARFLPALETDGDTTGQPPVQALIAAMNNAAAGLPAPAPRVHETAQRSDTGGRPAAPPDKPVVTAPGGGDEALPHEASPDTVRISTAKLDALFNQTEELFAARQAAAQRSAEFGALVPDMDLWEREWRKMRLSLKGMRKLHQAESGRVFTGADATRLGKLLEFFDWNYACVRKLDQKVRSMANSAANDLRDLDGMVDTLLDGMKGALLFPLSTILADLPRVVRDLARDRGKEAELVVIGGDLECDRRILEEMKDPLLHLIRNSVDHGIESPEERRLRGKPSRGTISITASLLGPGRIELCVADDGAGVDIDRLPETAVACGVASRDEIGRMGEGELLDLVFAQGFSTRPTIDDISGRGLGLAVVREKAGKLGGKVTMATDPRGGTSFRVILPVTMSTFRGIQVKVGEHSFIVPEGQVERVARVPRHSVRTVENRETVELDNSVLAFARLADLLEMPGGKKKEENKYIQLVVLAGGGRRLACGVDEVIGEEEVLVKGLGRQLPRVRNIAGATVLGSGGVVPILHPGDLLKSAARLSGTGRGAPRHEETETTRPAVLIVEDSITARTLLKNILESAGYETYSAVDGIDALALLRAEKIDLVVSDVDMPRMNGFDLTARIRASRDFADLPVVLVTSLDSREDRERGIEAGANAYIVKSSFDQSDLLEAVSKLI